MGLSVLQPWVTEHCTLMMQTVLLTAVRGPDGVRKDHPTKVILRWFRRCVLLTAFERTVFTDPYAAGGGSFTGPLVDESIDDYVGKYLAHVDELPFHFQMHLMHASEIIGYKHPDDAIARWWMSFYLAIVNDLHLNPETHAQLCFRLGDSEEQWKSAEIGASVGSSKQPGV